MTSQFADGIQLRLLNDEQSINFGAIFENVVAQELCAHGFDLYYFKSKRLGELDFVVEYQGQVLPVEVKSGKDYERHNALSNVLDSTEYNIPWGLVLCNSNVKTVGKVTYMPIYMLMFLEQESLPNITYKFDLSGLKV